MSMPTSPYDDYKKTGVNKMLALAKTLCRLVQMFRVIIVAKFPESGAIYALLIIIDQLCELLPEADAEFKAYNDSLVPPADTSEETGGYDPSAPEALPPDYTPV
jgi:hypothetical protein